ncbi:hypothetical protein CVU83_01700 [Candidatus Falkowbacteria bacterium HGW-Falkowbacteria-2]|uniref:Uncharacterized protein n=1 Tax=Candidatus Falkowbacteria bacterium HGW-Falkowbacteria-2 TaxID=2013769 RepID=A0A2N2E146_9BACT|nr:MAG: hypothetical protein CVU83_01700 [Candidatus Falkowbacteria bacterium HGW-Falkowbacteria-2]
MNKNEIEKIKALVANKQIELLTKKTEEVLAELKKTPRIQFVTDMPSEVHMSNFEKSPDSVSVKNLGDIKFPEFPEIKIPDSIIVKNFPEQKEIQKVEIINHKEAKDNSPFFSKLITKAAESIGEVFRGLWEGGISIKQNNKKTPLYVVHVDEKGAPIGRQDFQVFGGIGGGSSSQIPTQIKSGKVAVETAGTPVALGVATSKTKKVTITSAFANAGMIWIGDSEVSAADGIGIPLSQGSTYELELNNLASIFIDAESSGDSVSFVALS